MIQQPAELIRPTYTITYFTDAIYKVVKFKRSEFSLPHIPSSEHQSYSHKLESSYSRTRRLLLEYALCNSWTYFVTLTLDKTKYDRFDLDKFKKDISQFVRDQRKKWGFPISYLLVPEQHKDGCWHMHGLLNLPAAAVVSFAELRANGSHVPDKLIDGEYSNWPDFQRKFGYCSLGALRSPIGCAFYIQKYISKDLDTNGVAVGKRLLLHSNGLNRAVKHGDIYGGSSYLDSFLTNHYEFCSTGMTKVADGLDWTFAMDRMDIQPFDTDYGADELPDVEQLIEVLEQLSFMERMNV